MPGPSEMDVARIQRWCDGRVPEEVRDQARVEADVTDRHVTIMECRPPWTGGADEEWSRKPVARLRHGRMFWKLYWSDRNGLFHEYDLVEPTEHVQELLNEIGRDPTAIFWG